MKKNKSVTQNTIVKSTIVFLIVAVFTTIFEYSKQLIFQNITIWQSHTITIVAISISSFFAAFYFYQHKYLRKTLKNKIKHLIDQQNKHESEIDIAYEFKESINQLFVTKPLFFFQRKYLENQNKKAQAIFNKLHTELHNKEQSKKILEELNSTKNKFFSILSHDLKSPFSVILGFSNLLVKNAEKADIESIIKQAKAIHEGAEKAYSLLEDLLAWSGSQTGRLILKPEQINVYETIEAKFAEFESIAKNKNIKLENECTLTDVVFADSPTIKTVLRNLISNAIKFSFRNSKIIISSRKTDDKKVEISITDFGTGINENELLLLFRIDVQVSHEGTAKEKGTGLGLILCKEFVEKNNGKIWVESICGKGSRFIFTLPSVD